MQLKAGSLSSTSLLTLSSVPCFCLCCFFVLAVRSSLSVNCYLTRNFFVLFCISVTKSCLTLCDLMDCSPPDSSVHGISQARILEWVAISFSRGSSRPRVQTHSSCIPGRFFTAEPPGGPGTQRPPQMSFSTRQFRNVA